MKIRTGFVSNSSSSSFLIYGLHEPPGMDDILDIIKAFTSVEIFKMKWKEDYKKNRQEYIDDGHPDRADRWYPEGQTFKEWAENYEEGVEYFLEEEFWSIMGKENEFDFEFHTPYDSTYVGVCPTNCPNHLTMGAWKKQVEENLKRIFGEEIKPDWHEYAWRDG